MSLLFLRNKNPYMADMCQSECEPSFLHIRGRALFDHIQSTGKDGDGDTGGACVDKTTEK